MKKQKFNIEGMTCSSCSAHVEKATKSLKGIKSVNVNLLSNSMVVEFDENILDENQIIKAVQDSGYGASIEEKGNNRKEKDDRNEKQKEMINNIKKRLIFSIIFLIPLMYVAMHHMLYEWFRIPVPNIVKNLFHGNENALTFSLTQFILLLPIVYLNRNYFIVGFKRLWKRSPNMDSLIALGSTASIVYGLYTIYKIGYLLGRGQLDIIQNYSQYLYFESAGMILTLITVRKIFRN